MTWLDIAGRVLVVALVLYGRYRKFKSAAELSRDLESDKRTRRTLIATLVLLITSIGGCAITEHLAGVADGGSPVMSWSAAPGATRTHDQDGIVGSR